MADPDREVLLERLAQLEAELAAAQRTIDVLIDRVEQQSSDVGQVDLVALAARMEHMVRDRTREAETQRILLQSANSELRALTANLDQIVKSRTRALAESEAQLRQKHEDELRQGALKAEFIAIMAHELRTPLTSIVGYVQLLKEGRYGELPPIMMRPLGAVHRNTHRLKRLVEDMLEVGRLEAGKVRLKPARVVMADIVLDAIAELSPHADAKQQTVTHTLAIRGELEGDGDKLHRIVINLLSNSIRYSPPESRIVVSLAQAEFAPQGGLWMRLTVRDNGPGIAEEHRARIFEPFSDVVPHKHHTSAGPDSAGLGLFISRGLIEAHGGVISVDSTVGEFTEFAVLLPMRTA